MLAVEKASARSTRPAYVRGPVRRRRGPEPEAGARDNPAIVTVFMEPAGTICHSRCRQPLEYQGTRGQIEVDFYCLRCVEHVSLPLHVLPRIPQISHELTMSLAPMPGPSAVARVVSREAA